MALALPQPPVGFADPVPLTDDLVTMVGKLLSVSNANGDVFGTLATNPEDRERDLQNVNESLDVTVKFLDNLVDIVRQNNK